MVMSTWANTDNHFLYPNTAYRSALTQSELQATQSVSGIWNGAIGLDGYYTMVRKMGYNVTRIDDQLNNKDFTKPDTQFVLLREEIINKPIWMFRAMYKLDYDPKQLLTNQGYSKVFDCRSVSGFLHLSEKRNAA